MKKPPTKAENDHMGEVAALGCIICGKPAHVHHIAGHGMRASHYETIPLCPFHHMDGGFGEAVHQGRRTWESNHGTEKDMLSKTLKLLKDGVR